MGTIEKLFIQMDDRQLVYNPGETINGKVVMDIQGDETIKAVCIKLRGKCYMSSKKGRRYVIKGKLRYYFRREHYINEPTIVFGPKEFNNGAGELRSGHHSFPFTFTIPDGVPGSFERPVESQDCYVRYWLKAYVDGTSDEYKLALQVASVGDLNQITDAMKPLEASNSTNVCCLCWRKGPITVRAKTDRKAYVPGEIIRADIEIEDNTGRGTKGTTVNLIQVTAVIFDGDKFYIYTLEKSVAEATRGGIAPFSSDSWVEEIVVPPLPVSGLLVDRISVTYKLSVTVNIRSTLSDMKIDIPIIIGSIPHVGVGHAGLKNKPPHG